MAVSVSSEKSGVIVIVVPDPAVSIPAPPVSVKPAAPVATLKAPPESPVRDTAVISPVAGEAHEGTPDASVST